MGHMKGYVEDMGAGLPDYRLEPPDVEECEDCGEMFVADGGALCPNCRAQEPDEERMQARKDELLRGAV